MANYSLFETGFGLCQRESVLLALCDCCRLGLNRPLFLDFIGLPVSVWLTYYKSLIGKLYFDLNFLSFLMVSYHPYQNFSGYFFFHCRNFPIVPAIIPEVSSLHRIGPIVYLILHFYFQNLPIAIFHYFWILFQISCGLKV